MFNPIMVAGSLAVGLGGLVFLFVGGESRAQKRRTAVGRAPTRAIAVSAQDQRATRKKQIAEGLRDLEKANRKRRNLQARIEQAGLSMSRQRFVVACVGIGLLLGAGTWLESKSALLAAMVAVIGSAGLPRLMLERLRRRRVAKFVANFPNAIDIIVRGVKSGLPLGDTIRIAANESAEPVKSEFVKVVESLSLGLTLPEAVERMAQRIPVAETNFFSIVISIQGQAGGNLSEAIGNLSRVLRERKKMKGKIGAMSMEAKASAAIIGVVPFLVVGALYVSSPSCVSLLWTTSTLSLSTWLSTETAKAQLAQAGYRGAGAEYVFLAFRLIAPIAFFLIAAVYSIFVVHWDRPLIVKIGAAVAAAYAGIKAPELFLRNTIAKRGKELERAYPNTLDLLLICVESGMSIELAVRKVSQEIGVESVAMAEEMALLAAEMSFLEERRTAFENLGTRTGLESIRSLITVLSQSERYGTPLGAALRVLAQESRDQRMTAAEKKAAALPPALTVPMILFFLPGLFAAILSPAAIQINHWS
jgi:Flp pilus assembly protein TadB